MNAKIKEIVRKPLGRSLKEKPLPSQTWLKIKKIGEGLIKKKKKPLLAVELLLSQRR